MGSPPKEGGAPPSGQSKANSEAARKFLEKEKSDSVDGTTRKKKIRHKEKLLALKEVFRGPFSSVKTCR